MLEKEFEYYRSHQEELAGQYLGKYLLISGESFQGAFDSELEAYSEGQRRFGLGNFLLRRCQSGEDSYSQTFNLHVVV